MSIPDLPQLPPFFDATPEIILKEARQLIRGRAELWYKIERSITPDSVTVQNFVKSILDNENEWIARKQHLCCYASSSPNKDVRHASKEASGILDGGEIDLYLRQRIYALADSLVKRCRSQQIDIEPEMSRWLEKFHYAFIQNGCGLPSQAARDSFRNDLKQLHEHQRQFQQNLRDDQSGLWLSDVDLQGVPAHFFQRAKRGEGDNKDKYWVPMKAGFVTQVLKYAENETARRAVITLFQNRLIDRDILLHRDMVLLRDRLARQLGFANYAALKCQETMIDSPEKIWTFLNEIQVPRGPGSARSGEASGHQERRE